MRQLHAVRTSGIKNGTSGEITGINGKAEQKLCKERKKATQSCLFAINMPAKLMNNNQQVSVICGYWLDIILCKVPNFVTGTRQTI